MVPPVIAQPVDTVDLERHKLELDILTVLGLLLMRECILLPPRILLAAIVKYV